MLIEWVPSDACAGSEPLVKKITTCMCSGVNLEQMQIREKNASYEKTEGDFEVCGKTWTEMRR